MAHTANVEWFCDQVSWIDYLFTTDPAAARRTFAKAYSRLAPPYQDFLHQMRDMYSDHEYEYATEWLRTMYRKYPGLRRIIKAVAPQTDSHLFGDLKLRAQAEWDEVEMGDFDNEFDCGNGYTVQLEVAEWQRMPIRKYNRPDVLDRRPQAKTDAARRAPAKVKARQAQREAAAQRRAENRASQTSDAKVETYFTTDLFRDERAVYDAQPEWVKEKADREAAELTADQYAIAEQDPRVRHNQRIARQALHKAREATAKRPHWVYSTKGEDHAKTRARADREYVSYVATQYGLDEQDTWDAPTSEAAALEARANDILRQNAEDTQPDRRAAASAKRGGSRPPRRRWKPISDEQREAFASTRTKIRGNGDAREAMPYEEEREPKPWEVEEEWARQATRRTVGWRCLSCWIERSELDNLPTHHRDGSYVSDDGLCDLCREDGKKGLAPEPGPCTIETFAERWCEFVIEHYPASAHTILNDVYRRAAPHPLCRVVSTVQRRHLDLPNAPTVKRQWPDASPHRRPRRPALPAGQRPGRCEGCQECKPIHDDGHCTSCRVIYGLVTIADHAAA